MDDRFSYEQKLAIYKEALIRLHARHDKKDYVGICYCLREAVCNLHDYDLFIPDSKELSKIKPISLRHAWSAYYWKLNEKGYQKRIKALEKMIDIVKKKIIHEK